VKSPHSSFCAWLGIACLLFAGCANDPTGPGEGEKAEAPSFEPIVWPHAEGARRVEQDTRDKRALDEELAGWREKYELAQSYVAGGYDDEALQVLTGALSQDPPVPWGPRMRSLKTSIQVRRAEELLLRIDARGVKDYVAFGEPIDFVIRLRNVSNEVVTLLAPQADEDTSPSALMIQITRRDRDIHATELRRSWNRTVYIQKPGSEPLRIPAGGMHEIPVRIPAEAVGQPIAGLRTIEIAGLLRPTRMRKGSEPRTVRLPIRRGRVMALPKNFEPLTVDPLASMATALDTVAPAHLLIATEFVPPRRRAEAAGILARALERGHPALYRAALGGLGLLRERAVGEPLAPYVEPMLSGLTRTPGRADALMEGLSTVTGVRLAPDARLWKDWWRRDENRRRAVTPVEANSNG
jgi:hypothetical protein